MTPIKKGTTHTKCKSCLHRYLRDGKMVIQLCTNGEGEVLDGTRMPIGEDKRKEFVKDAYGKTFHKKYRKFGISSSDTELYTKWNSKIVNFYTYLKAYKAGGVK